MTDVLVIVTLMLVSIMFFWLESRITKLEHREDEKIDVPKHTVPMYTCITYPTECGCKNKHKSSKKKITNDDGPIGC
jgi:hypothetical protein